MVSALKDYVKHELSYNYSLDKIRQDLVSKGFLEEDVNKAIFEATKHVRDVKRREARRQNRIFTSKEVFDRAGYGFGSQQIINILFSLAGASLFLIGVLNGAKTIISALLSGFLKEYSEKKYLGKKFIAVSGLIFGLSFMFIALATTIHSVVLFIVAVLLGTIGVVIHGDVYNKFLARNLKKEKAGHFLRKISFYGLLITLISMLISGFILDYFPISGEIKISLFGSELPVFGYLLSFEIASITFILSGYVLSFLQEAKQAMHYPFFQFIKEHYGTVRKQLKVFTKSKVVFLLLFATVVTGIAQILGSSFYGLYIYQNYTHLGLGAFMNVILIFGFAILVSFLGPGITKFISQHVGEAPMLVFGTLLIALLNFVIAFNYYLLAIGAAVALATIGSAIVGVAQGLMVLKLLNSEERKMYYSALGFATIIPFIIMIPAGSLVAQYFGMNVLFAVLGVVLTIIVAPLYFVIVLMSNKAELVA